MTNIGKWSDGVKRADTDIATIKYDRCNETDMRQHDILTKFTDLPLRSMRRFKLVYNIKRKYDIFTRSKSD